MNGTERIPLTLPRHAANPRGVGRASEIWRLFQEAAVVASTRAGWPPERYVATGTAFVVYSMSVRHLREVPYGETLEAETWVQNFRRGILSQRELRLCGEHGEAAEGTQRWVHVDSSLKPTRASPELFSAFVAVDRPAQDVGVPAHTPLQGARRCLELEVWHTWMDPLGHVNHPTYVDFCDETTSRAMAAAGLDPACLVPVAEHIDWKRGALAGARLRIWSQLTGQTAEGHAVQTHLLVEAGNEAQIYAEATTVRGLAGGPAGALIDALR